LAISFTERKILIYLGEKNFQGRAVYFNEDAEKSLLQWLMTRNKVGVIVMTIMIRYFSLIFLFWLICPFQLFVADQTGPVNNVTENGKLALIEMFAFSNELPRVLIDLQNNIENLWSVSE